MGTSWMNKQQSSGKLLDLGMNRTQQHPIDMNEQGIEDRRGKAERSLQIQSISHAALNHSLMKRCAEKQRKVPNVD